MENMIVACRQTPKCKSMYYEMLLKYFLKLFLIEKFFDSY